MKRTFFALKISEETHDLFYQLQKDIPELLENCKIANPDNAHITLRFLGKTPEKVIPEIVNTVENAIKGFGDFIFECEGTGAFPIPKKPSILWFGINKGAKHIQDLYQKINIGLTALDIPEEKRKYSPHITFARIRNRKEKVPGIESYLSYDFKPIKNKISELIYFESKLTPQRTIHTPIKTFKL